MFTPVFAIKAVMAAVLLAWNLAPVTGHGRLVDPPGRSSMWRFGYNTPVNELDDQLFCVDPNSMNPVHVDCGICGDPADGERENEADGKYANGIIVGSYRPGQVVDVLVEQTHDLEETGNYGYYEFHLCPVNNVSAAATQACFNDHPVYLAGGSSTFSLPSPNASLYKVSLQLPHDLACSQCVLQWKYILNDLEQGFACADISMLIPLPQSASSPVLGSSTTSGMQSSLTSGMQSSTTSGTQYSGASGTQSSTTTRGMTSTTTNGLQSSMSGVQSMNGMRSSTSNDMQSSTTSSILSLTSNDMQSMTSSGAQSSTTRTLVEQTNEQCGGVGRFAGNQKIIEWCKKTCGEYCPTTYCSPGCRLGLSTAQSSFTTVSSDIACNGVGQFLGDAQIITWCLRNCKIGFCPPYYCNAACRATLTNVNPQSTLFTTATPENTPIASTTASPQFVRRVLRSLNDFKYTPSNNESQGQTENTPTCDGVGNYTGNEVMIEFCRKRCRNGNCPSGLCTGGCKHSETTQAMSSTLGLTSDSSTGNLASPHATSTTQGGSSSSSYSVSSSTFKPESSSIISSSSGVSHSTNQDTGMTSGLPSTGSSSSTFNQEHTTKSSSTSSASTTSMLKEELAKKEAAEEKVGLCKGRGNETEDLNVIEWCLWNCAVDLCPPDTCSDRCHDITTEILQDAGVVHSRRRRRLYRRLSAIVR